MKIRFIVFALLSATFASTGFVTRAAADDLAAAATRLVESDARIVLVRDGVTMPPMDPEAAAQALSERIQQRGPQRLVLGLRVGEAGVAPLAPIARDTVAQAQWEADIESAKMALYERHQNLWRGDGDYYFQPIVAIPYVAVSADLALLDTLLADPSVVSINTEGSGIDFLDESVDFVGGFDAHGSGYTGNGYSVAVIDTGVAGSHAMYSGKVVSEACYSTPDPGMDEICANSLSSGSTASGAGEPCDAAGDCFPGHGSHVAAVAVGASVSPGGGIPDLMGLGVAADLVAIQAKSEHTTVPVYRYREADVASALGRVYQIAGTYSIAAVNMSFGLSLEEQEWSGSACDNNWPAVTYAVAQLELVGVMTVAAAGNAGSNSDFDHLIAPPACLSKIVSVGATAKDADAFQGYSSAGDNLDLLAPGGSAASPGTGTCGFSNTWPDAIWSAYPFGGCNYVRLPGTSQAAPHVAAAAAIMRQRYAGASPSGIRDLLDLTGSSFQFTHGGQNYTRSRIDVNAALTPPSAPSTPASLDVQTEHCYGHYSLVWGSGGGTHTEYQVEAAPNSSYSPSYWVYIGPATFLSVDVGATTYYRVRACNTVACSGWRNGSGPADPLGYYI
ncbi:MAG TPA: S8 family serine peptidase [Xanthomonadaceae bacterium]|nr:S8 family serine peptidase [Xanthomonadaceae bacterium]